MATSKEKLIVSAKYPALNIKSNVVCYLRTKVNNEWYSVTDDDITNYEFLFPGLDIIQQFRYMYAWLEANQPKRKTARGMKKFINGWLTRAHKHIMPKNEAQTWREKLEDDSWSMD